MHTIEFDFSLCSTVETVEENNVQVTVLNASVGPRLFNHREIDCLALDIRQQDTLCLGGSIYSVIPAHRNPVLSLSMGSRLRGEAPLRSTPRIEKKCSGALDKRARGNDREDALTISFHLTDKASVACGSRGGILLLVKSQGRT
jgi:hypothetical protein